jgi:hypothetical protein
MPALLCQHGGSRIDREGLFFFAGRWEQGRVDSVLMHAPAGRRGIPLEFSG